VARLKRLSPNEEGRDLIDLHNHILPGVDDGAASMGESLEIARQFSSEGVARITATPHVNPIRGTGPTGPDVRDLVGRLRAALEAEDIPIDVRTGNEILLASDLPDLLASERALPLGESHAVLVELPFTTFPSYAEEEIQSLVEAGYRPVLAHPERSTFIQQDLSMLTGLREAGAIFQLTGPSLMGEYGSVVRRTAEELLSTAAYSLAASDRHHPGEGRSLARVYRRIAELTSEETARLLLMENPDRLLHDAELLQPVVLL
jgi:protein-tyrosine phosphatase